MNPWVAFVIGLVVGTIIGVFVAGLLWAAKRGDEHIHQ